MISDLSIGKLQPDPDGLDFESLRKEAIRLAQALSGEIWSDFNLCEVSRITIHYKRKTGETWAEYE